MKSNDLCSLSQERRGRWLWAMAMVLALAMGGWAGQTTILSERTNDSCSPSQSIQSVVNPSGPGSLFAAQAWGLHQSMSCYESADDDVAMGRPAPTPNYLFIANASALVWRTDVTSNWERGGATTGKFTWLVEQNSANGGQFAMMVGAEAENGSSTVEIDRIQALSNHGGRGCSASMTDLIGDCGVGPNRPCIVTVDIDEAQGTMTIGLAWESPAEEALLYSRDSEDGQGTGFDWSHRSQALDDMIRAWEIFYTEAGGDAVVGDASAYIQVSDEDSTRVDRGDGLYFSTDRTAQVVLPLNTSGYELAVSPVFDGPPSVAMPGDGGFQAEAAVTLARVLSGASPVVVQTSEVAFEKFSGRYQGANRVKIEWTTSLEIRVDGFKLYRSFNRSQWIRINDGLVPASGVQGGAAYEYNDFTNSAISFRKYYYRIVAVSDSGDDIATEEMVVMPPSL